jgi:hypothetical protein
MCVSKDCWNSFFSKSESLDFLVISESDSTVFPSSLSGSTQLALSRTTCFFFPSLMSLYWRKVSFDKLQSKLEFYYILQVYLGFKAICPS